MSPIEFSVNGKKCTILANTPRDTTLSVYIRYTLGLPGTKAMCRAGGCGACTVAVRARRYPSCQIETFAVNACLVLVYSCHGWDIITIEDIGNRKEGYNEIQKRMAHFNATQCGYCTPGWVMAIYSLLSKHPNMTMENLEKSFGSNTCRCTGYRPILDTVKSFAIDATPQLQKLVMDIEDLNLCNKKNSSCQRRCSMNSNNSDWSIIDDTSEIKEVKCESGELFVKVYTEQQIFEILEKHGTDSYMLQDGNTAKCIEDNFVYPRIIINVSDVESLKQFKFDQNLILGANISMEDCIKIFIDTAVSRRDEFGYLDEFAKHFQMIAHIVIRNIGSIGGNLMTKNKFPNFQSDIFVLFAAVGAMLTIRTLKGQLKNLTMEEFLRYNMKGVLIINVLLPPLSQKYIFRSYKVMPRNQNALAIVNASFLVKFDDCKKIQNVNIVYGNLAPYFIHATKTETYLKGKYIFHNETLQGAIKVLNTEIKPDIQLPKESVECRKMLAINLFYKVRLVNPQFRTGGEILSRPISHGSQDYQTNSSLYPLNKPLPKYEGLIQSSGEATYANDIPPLPREVFAAFVTSTIHSGEIDAIDSTSVLSIPGVVAVFTYEDIPGKNSFIVPVLKFLLEEHEEILVSKNVKYYGQPVAIVVAETEKIANDVSKVVKITYKNIITKFPVLTISEAKKDNKRILISDFKIEPKGRGNNVKNVIRGVYELEGQYHYYMETITSVVVPVDQGLEVYDATQWMDLTQAAIAQSLNLLESQIVVKVHRIGGGFGGKLSRSAQAVTACALVAKKLDRPCRFIMPLETNLSFTGKRLPCQCEYEVGVDDNGKIQYLNATLLDDKGYINNDNVMALVPLGFMNCYDYDYFNLKTGVVLTDLSCNTFMRAPGRLESISSIENIIEHIAYTLQKEIDEVRSVNMREDDNDIPILLNQLKQEADFNNRAKEIKLFNQTNRWMKKAIDTSVMVFPLLYQGLFTAFVTVYQVDASVSIATGGIEMGQGINTKARQVCAYELGIPVEKVHVIPNNSYTAANNAITANSLTSECICFAVIRACRILKERLKPVKEKNPDVTWRELIATAANEEIDLMVKYSMTDKDPDLSNYQTYGVAIMETQLDVLTGRFQILRVDILEDVGLSANPLIDVGQVEGAFVQGLGYFTSEKLIYEKKTGRLLTNRSLNYHVPLSLDIPVDFRVKFRYNSKNPKGVLGAKAVGEMGTCTSYVISKNLRRCIYESRKDSGYDTTEWINIDIPYTTESILKALDVKLEEMVLNK